MVARRELLSIGQIHLMDNPLLLDELRHAGVRGPRPLMPRHLRRLSCAAGSVAHAAFRSLLGPIRCRGLSLGTLVNRRHEPLVRHPRPDWLLRAVPVCA